MRTPLSISTRGRITSSARNTLTLAVIGWLLVSSTVPIEHRAGVDTDNKIDYVDERAEDVAKIIIQDRDIIDVIKIFLQCHRKV